MALLEQDKNNRTRGEDDDDDASKEDDKDVYRVGLVGRGRKKGQKKVQGNVRTGTDGDTTRPLPSPIANGTVHRNTTSPY